MINEIKELCSLNGTSGHEHRVTEYIISRIDGFCEYSVDALGNVIAFKKGRKTPVHKVMFDAHTDEVGVIITYIMPDGTLKFSNVGGINTKVLLGRTVEFENGVCGVVGVKPIHLCKAEERTKIPSPDSLYIDIGTDSAEESAKLVEIGMTGVFKSEFISFGDCKIKGKALDDRVGCWVLIDMIRSDLEYDAWFSFSVQEEIGTRGAGVSAYTIAPEYAVVLETTTAADIIDVPEHRQVCILSKGAAVSFMDRSTVYSKEMFDRAMKTAKTNGIAVQPKTLVAGGNNAGAVHKSRGGVKTVTVNTPCRYLHSASCVCDTRDIEAVRRLAEALLSEFAV